MHHQNEKERCAEDKYDHQMVKEGRMNDVRSITDMHCHILPGIDDGAKDLDECMAVLAEARNQKISQIIVTPHFHAGKYMPDGAQVEDILREVRMEIRRLRMDIRLYPGHECYYYSDLVEDLDSKRALTLAGSRYVLVEFEPDCTFSYLLYGVQELLRGGYIPILAHFERYACLTKQERLRQLKERGCLLQMNFSTLLRKDSFFHRQPWKNMVRSGAVDFLGSDCHGTRFRPLHVGESLSWMIREVKPGEVQRILETNIEKILRNE